MTPKPQPEQLEPFRNSGHELIPLHRWNEVRTKDGKKIPLGKAPRDLGWRKRTYTFEECYKHMEAGGNVGVRLRAVDLVVDVDPRNFPQGVDVFQKLVEAVGLQPDHYPHVVTGSGGHHYYLRKPADVRLRTTMPDFPGVEMKSFGTQVVAPGSVHPNGQLYTWDTFTEPLENTLIVPDRVAAMYRVPVRPPTEGGGEIEPEKLEDLLSHLDPKEFRDHDKWLRLMMASHHGTNGLGRDEFLNWSAGDPQYAGKRTENGKRWDSLHAQGPGSTVGIGTLYRELIEAGKGEFVPRQETGEEFADDLPPEGAEGEKEKRPLSWLHELNKDHWAVNEDGKFAIYRLTKDSDGRICWQRSSRYDFESLHCNKQVETKAGVKPLGEAWIKWPRRREAKGVCFEPEREMPGWLNMWQGWGLEPKQGDWSYLQELIREVICNGDETVEHYLLDWIAYLFQHPASPSEVAVVMRGARGTGKGTLGRALAQICGHHGLSIGNAGLLTGRFNGYLRTTILLFADEAFYAGDRAHESQLKHMITEPRTVFESKGKDPVSDVNRVHLIMASNESWVIPAGLEGERRFLMLDLNKKRQGHHDFFKRLNDQLNYEGGLAALLHAALTRDIGRWHPRENVPQTAALTEQKLRTLQPLEAWWLQTLRDSTLHPDWEKGSIEVFVADVLNAFSKFSAENGIKRGRQSMVVQLGIELKRLVPHMFQSKAEVPTDRLDVEAWSDGRARTYKLPRLKECREYFATQLLGDPAYDWGDNDWL